MSKNLNVTVTTSASAASTKGDKVRIVICPCTCGGDMNLIKDCSLGTNFGEKVADAATTRDVASALAMPQGTFKIGVITGDDKEPSYWRHGIEVPSDKTLAPLRDQVITLHY